MIIIELINYVKSDFIDIVDIYRKILSSKIYTEGNISRIKTHLLAVISYTKTICEYGYCDTKSDIIKKIFDIGVNTINIIENIKGIDDIITSINNIVWVQLVLYTLLKHNEVWLGCILDTKINFIPSSIGINIIIPESKYDRVMHEIIKDIYPEILLEATIKTEPLIAQSFELINDIDYSYIIKSIESPKLDTQIAFTVLKRRGDNNKERENNMVSKDEILLKVKEITEKITGRSLPDNIMDKSTISINTTSESIRRFTIFMEFVDSLTNKLEDDTDKDYIKDIVYNTILSILKYHKNKMDYKTISRLYNTVYTINDILNKGRSNIGVYPVFDYVSWVIYALYCLSMGNLNHLKETAFDIDYDNRTITIEVYDVDNIVYITDLLKNIDRSYMGIHFSIIDDKGYLDRLSKLNMDDFKPKKTIFCIVGESGSGKDTLVSYTLKEFGIPFKTVISYTDREMRENETNGVEHHFVYKDTMSDLLKNMEIASYTKIGDISYCTLLSDLEESDICIINPNGLNGLKIKYGDRFNFVTVYIDCPYDERKKRLENRSDFKSSFEKRAFDEEEQFTEFRKSRGYDHVIDNGTISTVYKSAMVLFDIFRYYRKDIR